VRAQRPQILQWLWTILRGLGVSIEGPSRKDRGKKAQVFSFIERSTYTTSQNPGYYKHLSTVTGGACIYLTDSRPEEISKLTVELLLAWTGAEKVGASEAEPLPADLSHYVSMDNIKNITDEAGRPTSKCFYTPSGSDSSYNICRTPITAEVLKMQLPKKTVPIQDFAKRYGTDVSYKKLVIDQLRRIVENDVTVISLNPIFGSLWRAVCSDRENPARDELIRAFGLQVDRFSHVEEKARMKS